MFSGNGIKKTTKKVINTNENKPINLSVRIKRADSLLLISHSCSKNILIASPPKTVGKKTLNNEAIKYCFVRINILAFLLLSIRVLNLIAAKMFFKIRREIMTIM